jgi:hypothetical protein
VAFPAGGVGGHPSGYAAPPALDCALPSELTENEVMKGLADSYVFWILLFVVLVVVYLVPTLIGVIRGVDRLALVFLVNLIGAPTGIGWVAALILAFGPRRLPPQPPWHLPPGAMNGQPGEWMPSPRTRR